MAFQAQTHSTSIQIGKQGVRLGFREPLSRILSLFIYQSFTIILNAIIENTNATILITKAATAIFLPQNKNQSEDWRVLRQGDAKELPRSGNKLIDFVRAISRSLINLLLY